MDSTLVISLPDREPSPALHLRPFGATLADPSFLRSHLRQCPLCLPHLDEDPEGDAEHGGQGHEPANAVAPGGVSVDVVVLERLVLHQEEDEDALRRQGEVSGA